MNVADAAPDLQPRSTKPRWLTAACLLAILLAALGLRLVFFVGSQGTDDVMAAKCAHAVATAPAIFCDRMGREQGTIVRFRLGLILPIAATYAIFGVSYATSYIFGVLTGVGSVLLAWVIARKVLTPTAAWIAAVLMAICPLEILYSTILLPDGTLGFYQGLSALLLILALQSHHLWRRACLMLACGLVAWLAWMTKEVGIQMIMLAALVILVEFVAGRRMWTGTLAAVGFGMGLCAESIFYWATTGNPFFRFALRSDVQKQVYLLADATGAPGYLNKLLWWWDRLAEWGGPVDLVVPAGAIVAVIYLVRSDRWRRILALWFLVGFAFFMLSFMFTFSYAPRRFLVLTMPAALLVADAAVRLVTTRRRATPATAIAAVYVCLLVAAIVIQYRFHRSYQDNERAAYRFIENHPGKHAFYTDHRTMLSCYFYNDLTFDPRLFPIPYTRSIFSGKPVTTYAAPVAYLGQMGWMSREAIEDYCRRMTETDPTTTEGCYVLLNWHYLRWQSEKKLFTWPDYVNSPPLNWRLLEIHENTRRRDPLNIFQVASTDHPPWSRLEQKAAMNLDFRRTGDNLLPDHWTLAWVGDKQRPAYDVIVTDPPGAANSIRLQSPDGARQYFFTGPGGFTHPPGPLDDPDTPVLEADRWFRLELVARTADKQKASIYVFLYDEQDRRSTRRLGRLSNVPQPAYHSFFFRTDHQPTRYRIGMRLNGRGPVRISDLKLFVQEPGTQMNSQRTSRPHGDEVTPPLGSENARALVLSGCLRPDSLELNAETRRPFDVAPGRQEWQ